MKLRLVGYTEVSEGINKNNKPYMLMDLHMTGQSSRVTGERVKELTVDLLKFRNVPPFELGNVYSVDFDSRGYLEEIELLEAAGGKG